MIYECLIAPTESPYSLLNLKRALLTYDKIKILDPSDRDLMPSSLIGSAIGLHPFMGIIGQAVRPLGKTIGYDEISEKIFQQLKPAIKQNLVEVISIYTPPPQKGASLFIGSPPTYNYPLSESLVYDLYRGLAENIDLITDIISPSKHALLRDLESSTTLALGGMADDRINNGPELPFFHDDKLTSLQRAALTRIARGRIATAIKCAGFCQLKNLIPVFEGEAYGSILTHMINKSHETLSEIEDDDLWIRRNRVIELCHEEYLDDEVLGKMDLGEVIKLRTSAWGHQAKNREGLFESITTLALETKRDSLFEDKAIAKVKEYREQSAKLISERKALKFNITCDLTSGCAVAIPAAAALGTLGQISLGWSMLMTLLGAAPWTAQFLKENRRAWEELKSMEENAKRSACFGLHNFYSRIKH
jgi:hypothetical protein